LPLALAPGRYGRKFERVMTAFFVAMGVFSAGLAALGFVARRAHQPPPLEGIRTTSIAELETGRFRIAGTIVSDRSIPSPYDGSPCVFFEHADYSPTLGPGLLVRETERWTEGRSFYVDDGTGRVRVDPLQSVIEAAVLHEDQGLTAERRLRVGEEIEVVASFALLEPDEASPYRDVGFEWRSVADEWGAPRLSYRTLPGMLRPQDEVGMFIRASSIFVASVTLLLAALVALVG
jgi:hypothetical protein